MLDIKVVREQPDVIRHSIAMRHLNPEVVDLDRLLELDEQWRQVQQQCDALRAERNQVSSTIKKLSPEERQQAIARVKEVKVELSEKEARVDELKQERDQLLKLMPNMLDEATPQGHTDEDNVEISKYGTPTELDFEPRDHLELGQLTDTIDMDAGARVAGSNFYYLKNEAARMELALCQYAMELLMDRGFVPFITPDIARDEILDGVGFSPRGPETQIYSIEGTETSLVGTAEITLGGYHAGQILEAEQLPLRYLGISHCFRTEAGSHGRASKGLYRVHQFTKAEMFVICAPEDSPAIHEEILALEEELLQGLKIPYRVVLVCSGDLGAPAAKKYDIEAWMPGRDAYGEVTSCSNCTDYQARRLGVRYRPEPKGSPRPVHLLNGTALAISRTLIAIYENYQREDGSVAVPEVLQRWMGGDVIPCRQ